MTKRAKRISLSLVAFCVLAVPLAIAPSGALAQGAEEEYNLDLPGSGGDQTTPTTDTATNVSDSEDSDGFPVLVLVLFAAAGVGVGIAVWRMRTRELHDGGNEPPDQPS